MSIERKRIFVSGAVQGVGFRPAVFKIASKLNLTGFVYNTTKGVIIELQGPAESFEIFLTELSSGPDRPVIAEIRSMAIDDIEPLKNETQFIISDSKPTGQVTSEVTPDLATCDKCLEEMNSKNDFRYQYPFINCTNCGPRYSIVKTIPYDRHNTTMSEFEMCEKCRCQYTEPTDRRFHAQPVACGDCGPKVYLTDNQGVTISQDHSAIEQAAQMLSQGRIVAIKGIGGFHLACDAFNESAVRTLRERKKRDGRPFAMMCDSIEKIKQYAHVTEVEEGILKSPPAPIVLLKKKENIKIAPSVAEGVSCFGFMLCYAPLHWLLFKHSPEVLVMTSGNISDVPLIKDNDRAVEELSSVADAFLMHNRDIYRQVDDSIVHVIEDQAILIRRARGYTPAPIAINKKASKQILAAGSDLKNTFALVKDDKITQSEHIGDLADGEVYRHYINSIPHLEKLLEIEPQVIACDLHPGYFSSQYAKQQSGVEIIEVQHHWAHIAAVMAENGIEENVIGLSCDGTGFGTDGAVWGFECLNCSLEDFTRLGHMSYFPLAGGDKASKEAIRPVIGLLMKAGGDNDLGEYQSVLDRVCGDRNLQQIIIEQIHKNINVVETSSLGRLFDAVAAMAGLGCVNSFEAQLPMALQAAIDDSIDDSYDFLIMPQGNDSFELSVDKMILQVARDAKDGISASVIAAKFHNCIVKSLVAMAQKGRDITGINTVALSGGVFCNSYLLEHTIIALKKHDFKVLYNKLLGANDGCVSTGQAAIAVYKTADN